MLNNLIENAIRSKGAHYDLAAIIYFFYKDEILGYALHRVGRSS